METKHKPATALPSRYAVKTDKGLLAGTVHYCEWADGQKGWRFMPTFQRSPSRKLWPTPQAAVRLRNVTLEAQLGELE